MPPRTKVNHPVLFLTQPGDVNQGSITSPDVLTIPVIQAHYKKRQAIEAIGTYPYKELTLFIFGSMTGSEENLNKHQLPSPYDDTAFYGDIIIIASASEDSFDTAVAFTPEDYETFYTKAFGGMESDDDEDDLAEEVPQEDLKDFQEEEEDEEEEEDDEEEEAEVEVEAEAEVEEVPVKKVKKRKAPAKVSSSSILVGTASAYPDRPLLSEDEQLQPESLLKPVKPTAAPRLQILKALTQIFQTSFSEENILKLELCIYNGSLKEANRHSIIKSWTYPLYVHLYKMHARHIVSNFNPNSYVDNKELFERFQQGEVTFEDIAKMDTYELFPSRWKEQFEQQQIREKRQLEGNRSMATDMFLCTRCHKRECTYYEMQTRSADEPMTIFITCLNCSKHWRQ
jgi:DNA-directed RNA polymerase subunit M/transcription elongation factor TFIIS/Pyruvate/2-oxoacid:ferredoxin oxidoreductase gamma subunit